MKFYYLDFHLSSPESWLVLLIFVFFLSYSYFSLIVLLIYNHKKNRLLDRIELEEG